MSHFIVRQKAHPDLAIEYLYQYPRRSTGRMYENRTAIGADPGQARVFNTRAAAKDSSKGWGGVVEVELKVKL